MFAHVDRGWNLNPVHRDRRLSDKTKTRQVPGFAWLCKAGTDKLGTKPGGWQGWCGQELGAAGVCLGLAKAVLGQRWVQIKDKSDWCDAAPTLSLLFLRWQVLGFACSWFVQVFLFPLVPSSLHCFPLVRGMAPGGRCYWNSCSVPSGETSPEECS